MWCLTLGKKFFDFCIYMCVICWNDTISAVLFAFMLNVGAFRWYEQAIWRLSFYD